MEGQVKYHAGRRRVSMLPAVLRREADHGREEGVGQITVA